jgi:hypothetical protein
MQADEDILDGAFIDPRVGRADKSLGILTQRFLDMLQDAPDGLADLNIVRFCLFIFSHFYFIFFEIL